MSWGTGRARRGREDNSAGRRATEGRGRGDFSCYLPPSLPIIYETTGMSAVDMILGRGPPLAFFHGVPIYFLSS